MFKSFCRQKHILWLIEKSNVTLKSQFSNQLHVVILYNPRLYHSSKDSITKTIECTKVEMRLMWLDSKLERFDDDCWRVHDPKVLPFKLVVKEVGTQYLCFALLLINAQFFYWSIKTNSTQFNARNSLACSIWEKNWQLDPKILNHEKCITSTNTNTNTHCQAEQCHSSPSSSRGEIVLEPAVLTRVLLRRSPHKRSLRRKTRVFLKHRKNCECCPGHYLIVRWLSVIVN